MFFASLYAQPKRTLSFEFFPPRSEQELPEARRVIASVAKFNPSYVTVTSGAESAKRDLSKALVNYSRRDLGLRVIAHQTCWGLTKDEIDASLDELAKNGIRLVLALRGDPSKNLNPDDFAEKGFENALEFTQYVAGKGAFEVAVAGYPETHRDAASPTSDLEYLKKKVDAGAQVILTQLFFEPTVYFRFVEKTRALGINIPIVPGILPISGAGQLDRFVNLTGATVPTAVRENVDRLAKDAEALVDWGAEYAINQCKMLLEGGAPGIHLYTLNKEALTDRISRALVGML